MSMAYIFSGKDKSIQGNQENNDPWELMYIELYTGQTSHLTFTVH